MISLDQNETSLVLMCLDRMLSETKRQLEEPVTERCAGAAYFCTKLCREQMQAISQRIKQTLADEAEEQRDGN